MRRLDDPLRVRRASIDDAYARHRPSLRPGSSRRVRDKTRAAVASEADPVQNGKLGDRSGLIGLPCIYAGARCAYSRGPLGARCLRSPQVASRAGVTRGLTWRCGLRASVHSVERCTFPLEGAMPKDGTTGETLKDWRAAERALATASANREAAQAAARAAELAQQAA